MHLRLLERLSPPLLWWQSVLFLSSLRKCGVPLQIARQQPSCPQTGMKRESGAVLGPERIRWHSARNCSSRAIHCAEGRPTGWLCLSISSCLGVSGLFAYTSVQEYWRGGDMWEHARDLTACHSYDKAELWLMGDRWTGENGWEMCSISMIVPGSAVLMFELLHRET